MGINEHFEPDFNAAMVPKDIIERAPKALLWKTPTTLNKNTYFYMTKECHN